MRKLHCKLRIPVKNVDHRGGLHAFGVLHTGYTPSFETSVLSCVLDTFSNWTELVHKETETTNLIVFAVGVFCDVLGLLELRFQERNTLVVRKAAALQRFAVPTRQTLQVFAITT